MWGASRDLFMLCIRYECLFAFECRLLMGVFADPVTA